MILLLALGLASLPALAQAAPETPGKETAIGGPASLALDNDGHLFVAEIDGNVVGRLDLRTNMMSTIAGTGKDCCYREGSKAIEVSLDFPRALAVDSSGNLFIADGGSIRKVDAHSGLISTFNGREASGDTKEGQAIDSTSFQSITGLAISSVGEIYIADDIQEKVFKVNSQNGKVFRVAGSGVKGMSGDGGSALNATFRFIRAIALDPAGNLFIADSENCRIRRVDHQTNVISTAAITGDSKECPPPPGTNPLLPSPEDLALGPDDSVYVVEPAMNVVVRLDKSGSSSIVAGTGGLGSSGDGALATEAELSSPSGLAIDSNGDLFVSDIRNNRIRKIDARTKVISTVAGNGFPHTIHSEQ